MADPTPCPACGSPVPAGSPGGACPRCLLAAGLESGNPAGAAAAAPPSPGEIGRHFPALEVLEVLGQGGMGIVYKARHRNLDRLVALKVLPPEAAREAGFAERFSREARTLARLQHPHIVGVHDFGETGGLYYLVMEFVDGPNLRQVLRAGSLDPRQALAIVPQVCDALQYAHDQGVVHRDIKPENILMDREGRVKIADFGLAKIVQRAPLDLTITRAGQVMGTVNYMAPEQYRAPDSVDHRADIYSLGVVFYEMLTGEVPMGVFAPPSRMPGVDVRLDGVVMRALEKERENRWQHASEVRTQVDSIAAGPAAASSAASAASPAGPGPTVPAGAPAGGPVFAPPPFPPPPVEGRLHWPAVAGGLGIPIAVAAGLLFGIFVGLFAPASTADEFAAYAFLFVGLAAWITSIIAWAQIHHSGGRLLGKWWAIAGTCVTPFLLCCGASLLLPFTGFHLGEDGFRVGGIHLGDSGISIQDGPGGTRVKIPGISVEDYPGGTRVRLPGIEVGVDDRDSRTDWSSSARIEGGPVAWKPEDRLRAVRLLENAWSSRGGPYLHQSFGLDPKDAPGYRLFFAHFDSAGVTCRVVLTDGRETLSFNAEKGGAGWTLDGPRSLGLRRPGAPGNEWLNPMYGPADALRAVPYVAVPAPDRGGGTPTPPNNGGGTPTPPDRGGGTPTPPDRGGGTPTPPDASGTPIPPDCMDLAGFDADRVTSGPEAKRAQAAAGVGKAWLADPAAVLREHFPGSRLDRRAAAFRMVALALAEDGEHGRLVMEDPGAATTIALSVRRVDGRWEFVHHMVQRMDRAAEDADRDGWLGSSLPADPPAEDDAADACLVHGGPAGRSAADLAAVARGVRDLWKREGTKFHERPFKLWVGPKETVDTQFPGRAADYRLHAVALEEDGQKGRAVFTDGTYCISVEIAKAGDLWTLVEEDWEYRVGAAGKGDEDGRLYR